MLTLNLNFDFLSLSGESAQDENGNAINAAQWFANQLAVNSSDDPVKFTEIARELYKNKVLVRDKSDMDKLKDILKKMQVSDIVKAQILSAIDKAE